jgi:hypothetical protein
LRRSLVLRPEHRTVFISKHVREALQCWAIELEDPEHVGVPMACRDWVPAYGAPGVGVIYADASGEEGWAAWTFASGVVYMVSGVWGELDRDLIIADKELVASTIGLFVLGEALQFQYVWEYTDNTVALSAIRSLTPSTPLSQRLCAARVIWCSDRSVFVMGERITSANNEWADIGSRPVTRGGPAAVAAMAHELGLEFVVTSARLRQRALDHTCPRCSDISAALRRPQNPTEAHARAFTADTESTGSLSSAARRT